MGRYSLFANQSIDIDVTIDFLDTGWSISGGVAIHESCNSGLINNRTIKTVIGVEYKVTYTVRNRTSGEVYVIVGGVEVTHRTSNGTSTETFTAQDTSGISFWSNGDLEVSSIRVSDRTITGLTVLFNEIENKWVGYRS